jgi:glycosyltransferase involved in cell wall biosynthesis
VLRDLQPDLFLSPDGIIPLRTKTPCLPVIHDLNFEHYPEDLHPRFIKYYRNYYPQFARKATRIATVSEYSKSDIVKTYSIAPEKIDVVYNGASAGFRQLDDETAETVRAKYSGGAPYFLFVGSLHPRKNIVRLVQAFGQFRSKHDVPHKLLIVGERFWGNEALNKTLENFPYKNDVIFTGRISPEDLHQVMGAAFALTYVPYFEGFGIPIVEAMQCGVPVITANVTSMPEVAGDAALLVDPFSVDSIAAALETMTLDQTKRNELIKKAIERHPIFNWDRTTELLWDSMMKTIAQAHA